jgi:hypothetical protein
MTSTIHQILGWNCPTHGGFSNLNRCAWPDCLHGVAGSTVKALDPVLKGEREFRRLSWIGPESSSFHDWQTVKPSWLSLPRAYSYFETKILSANSTRRMSHYTSVDGALAIIQSNRIRFTDYRYLNDKREVTYAVDLMRLVLDDDAIVVNSPALIMLKAHLAEQDTFPSYNIYTASFSSDPNSLSQFRLYGPVALEFETDPNAFGSFRGDIRIGQVVYDTVKQTQLVKTFFDLVRQSEEKDKALIEKDEKKMHLETLIDSFLAIGAMFKHPTFSDEREIRLLYSEPTEILSKFKQEVARRNFRSSGGLIIPFTDTIDMKNDFSLDVEKNANQKLPLKSVVIGPTAQAEALAQGVRELLISHEYHDVKVSLSEAPLRA